MQKFIKVVRNCLALVINWLSIRRLEIDSIELHKPIIKKFKRRRVFARFRDTVWAADLDEMVSLSSKNQNVKCSLCVIGVFTKYA